MQAVMYFEVVGPPSSPPMIQMRRKVKIMKDGTYNSPQDEDDEAADGGDEVHEN